MNFNPRGEVNDCRNDKWGTHSGCLGIRGFLKPREGQKERQLLLPSRENWETP